MSRAIIAVAAVLSLVAVSIAASVLVRRAQTQTVYALKVNGMAFTQSDVDAAVQNALRFDAVLRRTRTDAGGAPTDPGSVIATMISTAVMYQEALRRGLSCDAGESHAQLATQVAMSEGIEPESGERYPVLSAVGVGIAPEGYLDTPAPARTPDADTLIRQYLDDPRVNAEHLKSCATGKLYAQVRQQSGGGLKGEQAIQDLKTQLRSTAVVSGPALSITPVAVLTAVARADSPGRPPAAQ